MKQSFKEYLSAVGLVASLIERVESIHDFFVALCSQEIKNVFITDYVKEDGGREYESVWFLSDDYIMEAKQFIAQDLFDITPLRKSVAYFEIKKQDYDFTDSTNDKSRCYLRVKFLNAIDGEFKASKENCVQLKKLIAEHFKPNLIVSL